MGVRHDQFEKVMRSNYNKNMKEQLDETEDRIFAVELRNTLQTKEHLKIFTVQKITMARK